MDKITPELEGGIRMQMRVQMQMQKMVATRRAPCDVWVVCGVALLLGALLGGCGDAPRAQPPSLQDLQDADDPTDAPTATDTAPDPDTATPTDTPSDAPGDVPDAGPDPSEPPYLTALQTFADLARMAVEGQTEVKFLLRVAGAAPRAPIEAPCYFQNMRQFEWHILFLRAFPELADLAFDAYVSLTLRQPSRIWWGGSAQSWPGVLHPLTGRAGILSFTVYNEHRAGLLTVAQLAEVTAQLRACAPFAADLWAFVPSDPDQQRTAEQLLPELTAAGVPVVWPSQLIEGLSSVTYSEGEAYGYLRLVPRGQPLGYDYSPRDVLVIASAPNDISPVAALITEDPQNLHSHVNLRLVEKGIPNAAWPGALENAVLRSLDGLLVRVVATAEAVQVTPARLEDAEAFWAARRPPIQAPRADLSVTKLADFSALGAADAAAFGTKATNLAELHRALPAPHSPKGFGIPFATYWTFVTANQLDAAIESVLNDPRAAVDASYRRMRLATLRDQLRGAPLPPAILDAVRAQAQATFGAAADTTFLRFRSSSNVEDLDQITGAGLYDSYTGCIADDLDGDDLGPSRCLDDAARADLESLRDQAQAALAAHPERAWLREVIDDANRDLTRERPASRALRRTWASIWNDRAFDERAFYGIDHRQALMGVAVNPSFVSEQVNAVLITQLDAQGTHRLISQVGTESVVRPLSPIAVAEVITFKLVGGAGPVSEVTRWLDSSLSPQPLWSDQDLETLGALTRLLQAHFEAHVYPDLRPLRLDAEVKIDRHGQVVFKQARPYVTADP